MGDLHFVLPALNLSSLEAGILIMVQQQVRMMMFLLIEHGGQLRFLILAVT